MDTFTLPCLGNPGDENKTVYSKIYCNISFKFEGIIRDNFLYQDKSYSPMYDIYDQTELRVRPP